MGCDIHLFVEKKQRDGSWALIPPPVIAKPFDWKHYYSLPEDEREQYSESTVSYRYGQSPYSENPIYTDSYGSKYLRSWFDSRNYNLFSILANVRNDGNILDYKDARGVPPDASEEYRKEANCSDYHHHSYFTLAELKEWLGKLCKESFIEEGVVSAYVAEQYLKTRKSPTSWSRSISGGNIRVFDLADFMRFRSKITYLGDGKEPDGILKFADMSPFHRSYLDIPMHLTYCQVYVKMSWIRSYEGVLGEFTRMMNEVLQFGGPDELRIVFHFDN